MSLIRSTQPGVVMTNDRYAESSTHTSVRAWEHVINTSRSNRETPKQGGTQYQVQQQI